MFMLDSSVVERVSMAVMSESFAPAAERGRAMGIQECSFELWCMPRENIGAHASRHTAPRHCVADCVNDPDAEACPMRAVTYLQQMLFYGVNC